MIALLAVSACNKDNPEEKAGSQAAAQLPSSAEPAVVAAQVPAGALRNMPWLLGTFRGEGADGTTQAPFFERYSLADDSTLIVESFKDSTLSGAIDSTRYELRRDSLTTPGARRYIATAISGDSVVFGPLVAVNNSFVWRKGDAEAWTAVIIPTNRNSSQRVYRMNRIRK